MNKYQSSSNIIIISNEQNHYFELLDVLHQIKNFNPKISWCSTVEKAKNLIEVHPHCVCIFDDITCSEDTFNFLKFLNEHEINIPLIIISDGKSKDRDLRLLRAGASDYLIKGKIRPDFLYRSIFYSSERSTQKTNYLDLQKDSMREHKLYSLGHFAANIANSMADDLAETLSLLKDLKKTNKEQKLAKRINRGIAFLSNSRKFINKILELSPNEVEVTPNINLSELIIDLSSELKQELGKKYHVISAIDYSSTVYVDVNIDQITQALEHLTINAAESMPEGGKITLKLSVPKNINLPTRLQSEQKRYACIEVIDKGCGIAQENINHLFEPTYTTKQNSNQLGLGLAQVFAILKGHQGWITVKSKVDQGSSFFMYIPISQENLDVNNNKSRGLVMVIEEDLSCLEICKLYFSAAALDTRIFNDIAEALDWYQNNYNRVDLVMYANRLEENDLPAIAEIQAINPEAKIAITSDNPERVNKLIDQKKLMISKIFPSETKYLSAISWVSEGLNLKNT